MPGQDRHGPLTRDLRLNLNRPALAAAAGGPERLGWPESVRTGPTGRAASPACAHEGPLEHGCDGLAALACGEPGRGPSTGPWEREEKRRSSEKMADPGHVSERDNGISTVAARALWWAE